MSETMTVRDLKEWLKDRPDDMEIYLCIEWEGTQYDVPMTDCANTGTRVILLHEEESEHE